MIPVISVGSLKTSGTSTLAMTLAGVAAAAEIPVIVIDAARDGDLAAVPVGAPAASPAKRPKRQSAASPGQEDLFG